MVTVNATAQVAAFCGILVIQIAYLIGLARLLGPDGFGTYSFLFSITQILLVGGDLGLHNTALRRISLDPEAARRTFSVFFSLKLVVSATLFLLVLVLALWLPGSARASACLVLMGAGMFFHLSSLSLNIAFQAHGKLYLASINSLLLVILHTLIGLLGVLGGGGLVWLGQSYMSAALLALFLNWQVFRRQIHPVAWAFPTGGAAFFRESLPVGLGIFFENVALRIVFTLLNLMADSYHTGLFSAANRITSAARNLPAGIFSAVLPVLASLQGRQAQLAHVFRRGLGATVLGAVPVVGLILLFTDPLIGLLYGPEYAASSAVLRILAWATLPAFVNVSFTHLMLSQRRLLRWYPVTAGLGMAVNILANVILIPRHQSEGAALAALITEVMVALVAAAVLWRFFRSKDSGAGQTEAS